MEALTSLVDAFKQWAPSNEDERSPFSEFWRLILTTEASSSRKW
jgi:hypothetical protein